MAQSMVGGREDGGEHGREAVDVGCGSGEAHQLGGYEPNAGGGGGEEKMEWQSCNLLYFTI